MWGVTYDDLPFGFSWFPEESLTRTAHALDTGDGVWLIDPVDVPEAIERATALGPPAGVIQLLDRHNRDCAALAARLGVPHLRLPAAIPSSPFEVIEVLKVPRWHEARAVVARAAGARGRRGDRHERRLRGSATARPACTRCCAGSRPAHCAATGPSTCWSATAAACTARRPRPRSSTPTTARARTCSRLALKVPAMARAAVATRR